MRDEKEERKKQARSNKQTRQSNTAHPRQSLFLEKITFPRKNELPRVGLEPTTLYTLDRALYQLSYRGSSAGWAQISHLIVHLMNRLTINMYILTRDEKEGRKKQARSNKQQGKATQHTQACTANANKSYGKQYSCDLSPMRDRLSSPFTEGQGIRSMKTSAYIVYVLCAVLLCLAVCLTLLASFFLPSLISHYNMYMYIHM